MGKIVAIIGIDGSGKSTLIEKLGYESKHFYGNVKKSNSSVKRSQRSIGKRQHLTRFYIGSVVKIIIPNLISYYYYKFFSKDTLVFDRYSFDYVISLRKKKKKGLFDKILFYLFFYFPKPDYTILLELNPQIAFQRKNEFDIPYLSLRQNELKNEISRLDSNKVRIFNSSENINSAYAFLR